MKPRAVRIQIDLTEPERVALNREASTILGAVSAGHDPDALDGLIMRLSRAAHNRQKGRRQ